MVRARLGVQSSKVGTAAPVRFGVRVGIRMIFLATMNFCILPQVLAGSQDEGWIKSIHDSCIESLVFIDVHVKHKNGLEEAIGGTGFIVQPEGYVLSCDHVVPGEEPDSTVVVMGSVGGRYEHSYPLTVIRRDKEADLILLRLPQKSWHSLKSSAEANRGSEILAIGFPMAKDVVDVPGFITGVDDDGRWLTDDGFTYGMSGGPVFNRSGALVGIVEGGYRQSKSLNLVIPVNFAALLLQSANSSLLPSGEGNGPLLNKADFQWGLNELITSASRGFVTHLGKLNNRDDEKPEYVGNFTFCGGYDALCVDFITLHPQYAFDLHVYRYSLEFGPISSAGAKAAYDDMASWIDEIASQQEGKDTIEPISRSVKRTEWCSTKKGAFSNSRREYARQPGIVLESKPDATVGKYKLELRVYWEDTKDFWKKTR